MSVFRRCLEALLGIVFRLTRSAFLAFALASVSCVGLAAILPATSDWLGVATRAVSWMGAAFFVAALLLFAAPGPRAAAARENDATPPWIWLLGVLLLALPALAWESAAGLIALWREILVLLERVGFWEEFERGGQFSGLVMLPILAALCVPVLEALAAGFLIALPLGLLALLPTRSREFPRLFAQLVVCQAALVLASAIGAALFARLAGALLAAMGAAEDPEMQQAAEMLSHAAAVLTATPRAFVTPLLGHLLCVPVLLASPSAAAFFDAGAPTASAPTSAPSTPPLGRRAAEPTPTRHAPPVVFGAGPSVASLSHTPARHAHLALVALGALLLAFSLTQALRPRAGYASSDPAPGARLAATPPAVRVRFDRALAPGSTLWLDRVTPGEDAQRVGTSSGPDPADPEQRTLGATLPDAAPGVYQATWRAEPASGGVARRGSFHFGVGMPPVARDSAFEEQDVGARRQRQTAAGAALLIGLGVLLPRFPRRR